MSNIIYPRTAPTARMPKTTTPTARRYWLAAIIAVVGLAAGLTFGLMSFRDAQRHIDTFDRVSIPGAMTVQLGDSASRVLYYEGDETVRFRDLTITVTSPAGTPVAVDRYDGTMVYETRDLTQGRALATFDAAEPGAYEVRVTGVETGQLAVGDSFARRAAPGVLAGLGIAGLSVVTALALALVTLLTRPERPKA